MITARGDGRRGTRRSRGPWGRRACTRAASPPRPRRRPPGWPNSPPPAPPTGRRQPPRRVRDCSNRCRSPSRSTSARPRQTGSTTGACGGATSCCTGGRSRIRSGSSLGSRRSEPRSKPDGGPHRPGRPRRSPRPITGCARGRRPCSTAPRPTAAPRGSGATGRPVTGEPACPRRSRARQDHDHERAGRCSVGTAGVGHVSPALPLAVGDDRGVRRARQRRQGGGLRCPGSRPGDGGAGRVALPERGRRSMALQLPLQRGRVQPRPPQRDDHRRRPWRPRPPRHRQPPPGLRLAGDAGRTAGRLDRRAAARGGVRRGRWRGERPRPQAGSCPHRPHGRRFGGGGLPRAHGTLDGGGRPRIP